MLRSLRGVAKVRGEWESAHQVSWWLVGSFQWLAWVLWCSPRPNSHAEALTLRTSERDFIWTWDLVRCDWGKARSLGWAVIQCDLCPHKERRLGHRYAQKYNHVRTQWEDKIVKQEVGPHQTLSLLAPWSWTSRTVRNKFCGVRTTQAMVFCYCCLNRLR